MEVAHSRHTCGQASSTTAWCKLNALRPNNITASPMHTHKGKTPLTSALDHPRFVHHHHDRRKHPHSLSLARSCRGTTRSQSCCQTYARARVASTNERFNQLLNCGDFQGQERGGGRQAADRVLAPHTASRHPHLSRTLNTNSRRLTDSHTHTKKRDMQQHTHSCTQSHAYNPT